MRREASTFTGRQPRYCEPATIFVLVSGSLAKACKAFASCWGSWHGAANRRFLHSRALSCVRGLSYEYKSRIGSLPLEFLSHCIDPYPKRNLRRDKVDMDLRNACRRLSSHLMFTKYINTLRGLSASLNWIVCFPATEYQRGRSGNVPTMSIKLGSDFLLNVAAPIKVHIVEKDNI